MTLARLSTLFTVTLASITLMLVPPTSAQENADRNSPNDNRQDGQPSQANQNQLNRAAQNQNQAIDEDEETEYRGMEHAALGVMLSERNGKGARVRDILPGGPADRAGLERGDRIVKIDGRPMKSYSDVVRFVNRARPGQSAQLTVNREGHEKTIRVTLATREQAFGGEGNASGQSRQGRLYDQSGQYSNQYSQNRQGQFNNPSAPGGQQFYQSRTSQQDYGRNDFSNQGSRQNYSNQGQYSQQSPQQNRWNNQGQQGTDRDHGVLGVDLDDQHGAAVILEVWPASPAEQAGLRRGDEIVAIDNQQIRDRDDLTEELQEHQPGDRVQLAYYRNGESRQARVRLASQQDLQQSRRDFDGRSRNWDNERYDNQR